MVAGQRSLPQVLKKLIFLYFFRLIGWGNIRQGVKVTPQEMK